MHSQDRTPTVSTIPAVTQPDDNLRRSVAADIGDRKPGAVYYDGPRLVKVLDIITDRSEARRILRRKAAQFAIRLTDLHDGTEYYTTTVWTGSDRVLKAVSV